MPLTTKHNLRDLKYTITDTDDGVVTSTQTVDYGQADVQSLVVFPSPCTNGTDRKMPGEYSYTSTRKVPPRGIWVQQYEYGGVQQITYTGDFGQAIGYNLDLAPMPSSQMNTVQSRALSKLYEAIRGSEISLNTTIGEGRETFEMIRDIAVSAAKTAKELKRAKKKLLALERTAANSFGKWEERLHLDPLQTVGGLWLGWSVGLAPLLSDCENLRNHMANEDNDTVRNRPLSARASAYSARTSGPWVTDLSERLQYGIEWRLDNLHLFENWRLGLTVRPTLIWELTTLSFVVDYFVNIGQYLELLEASVLNNGFSLVGGYKTTTIKSSVNLHEDYSAERVGTSVTPSTILRQVDGVKYTQFKERIRIASLPTPSYPVVKLPRAAGPLLNVAALLSQILTRRASK